MTHFWFTDWVIDVCIIERVKLMSYVIVCSKCHNIHSMTLKLGLVWLILRLCFQLVLLCSFSAYKKSLKRISEVGYRLLEFLSLVCIGLVSGDISEDDDIECLIHPVALFVPHQINIFFLSNNSLVNVIFPPFLEVEDKVDRKIDRVIKVHLQVNIEFATVKHKSIADSHRINNGSSQLLNRFILCNFT